MSRNQRHIKSQFNIINEESYALQKPTNATFISEETMEINEETTTVRQESENVSTESKMDEDKETKGQTETEAHSETMEGETNETTETKVATIKDRSIEIKVKKIIEKVMQKLKTTYSPRLEIKQ